MSSIVSSAALAPIVGLAPAPRPSVTLGPIWMREVARDCCSACALGAFEQLTLAQLMGDNPPGPLEPVEARLVDLATGQVTATTGGLVPLDGIAPPEVLSWP